MPTSTLFRSLGELIERKGKKMAAVPSNFCRMKIVPFIHWYVFTCQRNPNSRLYIQVIRLACNLVSLYLIYMRYTRLVELRTPPFYRRVTKRSWYKVHMYKIYMKLNKVTSLKFINTQFDRFIVNYNINQENSL